MERREFLAGAGAAAAAWGLTWPVSALAAGSADADFAALVNRLFYENLLLTPINATGLGLDRGVREGLRYRLDDKTEAGKAASEAFDRAALAKVRAVDAAALSPAAQRNRAVITYMFEQRLAGVPFAIESVQQPYPITQQQGVYFEIPDFLDSRHPVETLTDAEAYLARLHAFSFALDENTEEQRRQAARGVIAPGWSLDLALGQMAKLRNVAAEDNPMVRSLTARTSNPKFANNWAGDWGARAAKIVRQDVYPALDRQIALLKGLRAKTPAGDGAWRMRRGDAIYAAALAQATTTKLTPEQVHKIGLEQVADITGKLDAILKGAGYTKGSVGERLTVLNHASDQLYPDTDAGRADLIASLNAGIAAMAKKLPQAFANYPSEPLEIRRVPVEIQDGASNGYYYSASLDGSRPAIYWINLKSVGDWPRYSLPALTYHEGIPGHHLQGGYTQAGGALPFYLKDYFLSAHGEGWALYAEQMADELGGYSALERAGYLQSFLFRAARLVVDTGIHHYRWSREKATAYMVATTGFAQARSQREVERYCVLIGQACSYKIGHTAWVAARTKAQAALGTSSACLGSTGFWRKARCRCSCWKSGSRNGHRSGWRRGEGECLSFCTQNSSILRKAWLEVPMLGSFARKHKMVARTSVYLLVAACSQSALETYGCACAGRSYTIDEIVKYRAGAARDDLQSLAEMEEYHMWRKDEYAKGTKEYAREENLQKKFFKRLLDLNDPKALDREIDRLTYDEAFEESLKVSQRRENLILARSYAERMPSPPVTTDRKDPDRRSIRLLDYIQRELAKLDKAPVQR